MIPRQIRGRLLEALADSPAVFLQGPRQSGKSTLVQSLIGPRYKADYLTLDDAAVLAAAAGDPEGFVAGLQGPVILDEVQRVPELFLAIKGSVDRDRRPGRFLLTGSANVRVVPKLSEALVGRVDILTLWPFSQGEIARNAERFIDSLFRSSGFKAKRVSVAWPDVVRRIIRGGYPEALRRARADRRLAWFRSYVTTIIQREVRDLSSIAGLTDLPRLLALIAARSSQLANYAELSRSAASPQSTLKRYLSLLEAAFLVQVLAPWATNLSKRAVKSPKLMLCDTGLAAALMGADDERLKTHPTFLGQLLETFVAMELRKQAGWSRTQPRLYHYRSYSGPEVDVVLEDAAGRVVGVEVKSSASVGGSDIRALHELAEVAGDRFVRGIVLYRGEQVVPFARNLHAVPLPCLWEGV